MQIGTVGAVAGDLAARSRALEAKLTVLDRQSMVILGDPTATILQD
jgi:hypothetical protein